MKQIDQILTLLEDTSFPQLILIDGAWGSGKTHFIKNELLGSLETHFSQETLFFSLYGISTINDFRDKIISLSLTDNEETSILAKYFGKAIDGAAINLGERGVGAVLSGAAGAYKYKLYGEFDNCVLVLDDLERVSDDNLIKNILGECLNLAETKNIKIIVVANEDKLSCKSDIEKVFADKYKFSFTHEEIVNILKVEYSSTLDAKLANELVKTITGIDSKNIRALKRAISKFSRIKEEIVKIENVFTEEALSRTLIDIVKICCAKFEYGFSKDNIVYAINSRLVRHGNKEKQEEDNVDYKKLDNIFDGGFNCTNEKLLSYCCDGIYEFTDIKSELRLPVKMSLLDSMKSPWAQNKLSLAEFTQGLELLEDFISNKNNIEIYEWFSVCDTYIYMLDKRIIDSKSHSKESLLGLCTSVDIQRFTIEDKENLLHREYRTHFYSQEINERYQLKSKELSSVKKEQKQSNFSQEFEKSWFKVEDKVHQDLMHTPFFQNISIDIIKSALEAWSNEEVYQFVRFVKERYRFENIQDFFEPELSTLKAITPMIVDLYNEIGHGLKVASLINLNEYLVDAYTRMDKNLAQNKDSSKSAS